MKSFYVDITKCKSAGGNFDSAESELRSASKKLDGAADGVKAMGGALVAVGACVDQIAHEAAVEAGEVAQLKNAINSILQLYYMQEAGLIGASAGAGVGAGATIGSTVGEWIDDVIGNAHDNIESWIDSVESYIASIISDIGEEYINDDGSLKLGQIGSNIFSVTSDLIDSFFDDNRVSILTSFDGAYGYLIDSLLGKTIDGDALDVFDDIVNMDLDDYLKKYVTLPEFDLGDIRHISTIGDVCKVAGVVGEVLDYGTILVADAIDVFYNEETDNFDITLNTIGYYATDVVIDGGVTLGANLVGDAVGAVAGTFVAGLFAPGGALAGALGGTAVAPGPGTAGGAVAGGVSTAAIAGTVTQAVVSGLVSNGIEAALNHDISFLDINNDGNADSVVDVLKYGAHNLVDDIVELAPQQWHDTVAVVNDAVNAGYDYVGEFVDNTINVVVESANDVYNGAVDVANDIYNGVADVTSDIADGVVDVATDIYEGVTETVGNVYDSVTETAGNVYDSVSETVGNAYDSVSDTVGEVRYNVASYAEDTFGITWLY